MRGMYRERELLVRWLYAGLTPEELELVPKDLRRRARLYFQGLVEEATHDVEAGRVVDGPKAMERLRAEIEAAHG